MKQELQKTTVNTAHFVNNNGTGTNTDFRPDIIKHK
jgi:hypothetical protein